MHTFLQIAQSVFNRELIDRPEIRYLDGPPEKTYEFTVEQLQSEQALPVDKRRGVEKMCFLQFITTNNVTTKTKFAFLNKTLSNIFINTNSKEKFLNYFTKIQKTYHVLSKFAYRYKFIKSQPLITKDVYMNDLKENQPRVFSFIQNNKKYLFAITDLVNILNTSLGNTIYFISEPLVCKNPYNNMPFNKSTLYNIYFFLQKCGFIMPQLFHQYFMTNFNLKIYGEENEELIRDYSIKQYVNKTTVDELAYEIRCVLDNCKWGKKLSIDPEFPNEDLVSVMRPYLELYYKGTYTMNESKRERCVKEYNYKIKQFVHHNKTFGRKYYTTVRSMAFKKSKHVPAFNSTCVGIRHDDSHDFQQSHIIEYDDFEDD
jgi:hypothetical protein